MRSPRGPALVVLVAVVSSACGWIGARGRTYELRGQVIAVNSDRREITIAHDEVPGYMPAMTMPFKVRDLGVLYGRAPGDLVTARLVVEAEDAYLTSITKVGAAAVTAPATAPPAASGFELLKAGDEVPDQTFVDQDGRRRAIAEFRGKLLAITFIYTRCPLPTFCPMMDRHFAAIQRAVKGDAELNGRVQLLSISFDPVNDRPPVLKKHAATLDADPGMWAFLTGDRDEIDRFASRFGVLVERDEQDPGNITHNLRTVVADARGRVVRTFTGNEWTPADVLNTLSPLAHAPR
jgi:protein SCO1/2